MAHTACLVCLISTANGRSKKKKPWKTGAIVAGTQQTLSNLFFSFDIYVSSLVLFTFWSGGMPVLLACPWPGNTKGGSITVPLTSYLTGLESAQLQLIIFVFIYKTD
jgi:hypothetical protein